MQHANGRLEYRGNFRFLKIYQNIQNHDIREKEHIRLLCQDPIIPNLTVGGLGIGPERDRNGATARQLSDSDATRTIAIQIIRGFLAGGEVPRRVKDV